ncbi:MAG: hypothetical protein J7M21_05400, partial [Planctomycetes bacterium]|nr:hypothetical protein [Planctomycetota bacterium]
YWLSNDRVFEGDKADTILVKNATHNVVVTGAIQNWNNYPGFNPAKSLDNFVTAFSGRFFPQASGDYNFRWSCDDRGEMYIDINDDGVFQAGEKVADYAWNGSGTRTLQAGRGYNLIFMAQEYGGGQSVNWWYTVPGGNEKRVDPGTVPGMWMYATTNGGVPDYGNNVTVEADSTIAVSDQGYVNLGQLTMAGNVTLSVDGGANFTGTRFTGAAPQDVTFNALAAGQTVGLGTLDKQTAGTLNVLATGAGQFSLSPAGANVDSDTTITVRNTTLAAPFENGENSLGEASLVLDGATLKLDGDGSATVMGWRHGLNAAAYLSSGGQDLVHDGVSYQRTPGHVFAGDGGLLAKAPDYTGFESGEINYSNNFGNLFPGFGRKDSFSAAWTGIFTPTTSGAYGFRWDNDDRGRMYIDLNQDGIFQPDEWVGADTRGGGVFRRGGGSVDLVAGEQYAVLIMSNEGGGSETAHFYMTPPGGSEALVNGGNPMFTAYGPVQAPGAYGNTATIQSDSTVKVAGTAILGQTTIWNATTLTVSPTGQAGTLGLLGLNVDAQGETTQVDIGANVEAGTTLLVGNLVQPAGGVPTVLTKTGAGDLIFNGSGAAADDANVTVDVQAGRVGVLLDGNDSGLPNATVNLGQGTTLVLTAGSTDAGTFNNTLNLNGASQTLGAYVMGDDSILGGTVIRGGDTDIPAGKTLEVLILDDYDLRFGGNLTGGGTLVKTGGALATVEGDMTVEDVSITRGSVHVMGAVDANTLDLQNPADPAWTRLTIDGDANVATAGIHGEAVVNGGLTAGDLDVSSDGFKVASLYLGDTGRIVSATTFALHDRGMLSVKDANALAGLGAFTVTGSRNAAGDVAGGWLELRGPQNTATMPVITVAENGALTGDTTGLAMDGTNVLLQNGAIFGGTVEPSIGDLGGSQVRRAIIGGSVDAGKTFDIDGDATVVDAIYSGVEF